MKTLHLLRHAKSAWNEPLPDRERGLNKRGRRDAPRMGQALAAELEPMVVMVSPARRARLTLEGLCQGWPELAARGHTEVEALYTFSWRELAAWLFARDDALPTMFIIGHNPALTDLINVLAGEHCLDNLPTAAYARLELDIDHWRDLDQGRGRLVKTLLPRQLDAAG